MKIARVTFQVVGVEEVGFSEAMGMGFAGTPNILINTIMARDLGELATVGNVVANMTSGMLKSSGCDASNGVMIRMRVGEHTPPAENFFCKWK